MHVIGPGDAPIYICEKGEIPGLFTESFWRYYETWVAFNAGMGLPDSGSWMEHDAQLVRMVVRMEMHYRAHFSPSHVMILYMEAIIKNMQALSEMIVKIFSTRR